MQYYAEGQVNLRQIYKVQHEITQAIHIDSLIYIDSFLQIRVNLASCFVRKIIIPKFVFYNILAQTENFFHNILVVPYIFGAVCLFLSSIFICEIFDIRKTAFCRLDCTFCVSAV